MRTNAAAAAAGMWVPQSPGALTKGVEFDVLEPAPAFPTTPASPFQIPSTGKSSQPILPIPDPSATEPTSQPLRPLKGGGTRVEIWSHDATTGVDKLVLRSTDPSMKSTDSIANDTFATAKRVADYYLKTFGRDGWDNKGSAVRVKVHAPDLDGTVPMNNARWYLDEGRIWMGDGDGVEFAPLGRADDVMAHEFGHGVIDSEVMFGQDLQEGAIHESWSDVFASGIDGNWLIGERVYTPRVPGDALRDMSSPRYSDMGSLPPVLDPVDDVHDVSGVATLAAVRAADSMGADEMRQVWYKALTDHMKDHSGYAGARDATIAAASKMYGQASAQVAAVRDAWDGVGITSATPKQLFGFEHQSAIAAVKGEAAGRTALWANGQPPKGASGTHFAYRGSKLLG